MEWQNRLLFTQWLTDIWKQKVLILFTIPALTAVLIFNYRPLYGIIIAFQDYEILKGIGGSTFVGLKHFKEFLTTPDFYNALKNTLGLNFLNLFIVFPLPIILAILINEFKNEKIKKTVQSITYLPHFISWIVVSGLIYKILDQDSGIVNIILSQLGAEKIAFFREKQYFWALYTIAVIWKELGWTSILYLSSITGISPEHYDAADVDGATRFQRILHITLPGIAPTIAVLLVLTIGSFMSSNGAVEPVLSLRNPMVSQSSDVIDVYALFSGIQRGYYSYATAIGLTQSLIGFSLIFLGNKVVKKLIGNGLF